MPPTTATIASSSTSEEKLRKLRNEAAALAARLAEGRGHTSERDVKREKEREKRLEEVQGEIRRLREGIGS